MHKGRDRPQLLFLLFFHQTDQLKTIIQRNKLLIAKNDILERETRLYKEIKLNGDKPIAIRRIFNDIKTFDKPCIKDIRSWCIVSAFPHVKFPMKEKLQTLAPGTIGASCCKSLCVPEDRWPVWWGLRWVVANVQFSKHKTETVRACKQVFEKCEIY